MHELPKYHETFFPILQTLMHHPSIHHRELRHCVFKEYYSKLPQELLDQKTSTWANTLFNRIIRWMYSLKIAKLVYQPTRGFFAITAKGKDIIKKWSFTLQDLYNDTDYQIHLQEQKKKKLIGPESTTSEKRNNDSPQDLMEEWYLSIEQSIKQELLDKLKTINPYDFEKIILLLLQKMGYGAFVETPKSWDGGIDGIINEDKLWLEKIYIQAKRYTENKVREFEIRNFIGAMSGDTRKWIFVTTSSFDDSAKKKAHDASHTIILIDWNCLVDLMYQYGVGVQVRQVYEIKGIDEDFFLG